MLLIGGGVAWLCALVCAYATFYIPFIYLNAIFALALGALVSLASKTGKVRNKNISVTIAAFCGLLAIYFSWAIWIGIFVETDSTSYAPGFIFESMAEIAEYGAWELFGTVPQGVVLYLFWAIEALLVIGVAGYIAQSTTEAVPYCEGCNKWAEETEVSNLLEWNNDMPGLTKKLETGNFDALLMIPLVGTPKQFTAVKVYRCPTCQQKHHQCPLPTVAHKIRFKKVSPFRAASCLAFLMIDGRFTSL
jgi:hypothetical protein